MGSPLIRLKADDSPHQTIIFPNAHRRQGLRSGEREFLQPVYLFPQPGKHLNPVAILWQKCACPTTAIYNTMQCSQLDCCHELCSRQRGIRPRMGSTCCSARPRFVSRVVWNVVSSGNQVVPDAASFEQSRWFHSASFYKASTITTLSLLQENKKLLTLSFTIGGYKKTR